MRFLADMGVSRSVVAWLRASGHDAVHLLDRELERLADSDVLALAVQESRILLTFDLDFGEIMAFSHRPTTGVILFGCKTLGHRVFKRGSRSASPRRRQRSRPELSWWLKRAGYASGIGPDFQANCGMEPMRSRVLD